MSLPTMLRALVLALLAATLLLPERVGEEPDGIVVLGDEAAAPRSVDPVGDGSVPVAGSPTPAHARYPALEAAVAAPRPPRFVVRESAQPPAPAELALLEAVADRVPILAALPPAPAPLRAEPPTRARSGRAAAIAFTLHGTPGDTITVRLHDEIGLADSLRVRIAPDGTGTAAFRVRPARGGWREWLVEAPDRTVRIGTWVREAEPIRVLIAAGPPYWETRFAMRALEEAGAQVTLGQPLGRGITLTGGGTPNTGPFPSSADRLAEFDAVIVFPDAPLDRSRLDALRRYVTNHGGGVLVVGGGPAANDLGLARSTVRVGETAGDAIDWSLPAELAPLPAAPNIRSAVAAPTDPAAGTIDVARADAGPVLSLRALGKGRAAMLGITETWRWRVEGGRAAEHREFWRSLVDWLADGLRDSTSVDLPSTRTATGVPVEVRIHTPQGASPPQLSVRRPDVTDERLGATAVADRPGEWRATFLPVADGVHALGFADETSFRTAIIAESDADATTDAWARLSLLAHRSGGTAIVADSLAARLAEWESAHRTEPSTTPWLRPLLFALVVLATITEWTVRRLRQMP